MKRFEAIIKSLKLGAAFLTALILAGLAASTDAYAQTGKQEFVKGQIIVELKPGASIDALNARFGTRTLQQMYGTNFYKLGTPKNKKEKKWQKRVSKDADVLSASLNPVVANPINVFARATQNFPDGFAMPGHSQAEYAAQHFELNINDIRLRSTGAGVLVAVIDTGVDISHDELAPRLWVDNADPDDGVDNDADGLRDDFRGWDFIDNDNNPTDEAGSPQATIAGHGTFIAGIVALLAPDAQVLPVRAFRTDGTSDAFTVASAIKYAADHGAHVINLSFGSPDDSTVLHDAVLYARSRGSVLIAAMGNENQNADSKPQFPAGWKEDAMGVAAIDLAGRRASFSNYGSAAAVSAPGVRIISTYVNQDYAMWSGTSFAAPFAAAEAALILQDDLRKTDTREVIENTADSIDGFNPGFAGLLGRGRINPLRALQSIQPITQTHSEATLHPTGVEPAATGKAEITVTSVEQEFEIDVVGLVARGAYKIVVDGNLALDGTGDARGVSSNFGNLKVEFSTLASGNHVPLPAPLNPVTGIRHVEIRDASDRLVLQGDFGVASGGGSGQFVEKKVNLVATGVLPQASGEAKVEVEPEKQELEIRADGLTPGVAYQIIADGITVGTRTAQSDSDNQGFFRVKFRSDGGGDLPLPAALQPVTGIRRVEVRNPSGQVVLQGDFQAGSGDDSGGGGDGGGDGDRGGDDNGGGGGDGDGGGGGESVDKDIDLSRTGVDPDAEGRVRVRVNGGREELEIRLEGLNRNANYTIIIDGFTLGNFRTDSDGEIRVEYDSQDGPPPPPQLRPVSNISHVDILDGAGEVVLSGDLPG
jgi:subtilisin family serine protease